jgi:hypothetical protein
VRSWVYAVVDEFLVVELTVVEPARAVEIAAERVCESVAEVVSAGELAAAEPVLAAGAVAPEAGADDELVAGSAA